MEEEVWRKIEGFSNYEVSSLGRVRSVKRDVERGNGSVRHYSSVIKKTGRDKDGYVMICLSRDDHKACRFRVHRLVALVFIPNPDNLPCINHKNEVKDDNRVENLEWCTYKYNANYGHAIEKRVETRKGFTHSEETRRKISRASKDRVQSEETKKKRIQSLRAFYDDPERSKEARKKLSESSKGRTHITSEETKKKMSQSIRAFYDDPERSKEARKKLSESSKGRTHSEETKKKLSQARKGHVVSEETRRKISQANKGRTRSDEVRLRQSQALKGRTRSEETKRKISESNKGRVCNEETKTKISQTLKNHYKKNRA